jgi:hypothetical protein
MESFEETDDRIIDSEPSVEVPDESSVFSESSDQQIEHSFPSQEAMDMNDAQAEDADASSVDTKNDLSTTAAQSTETLEQLNVEPSPDVPGETPVDPALFPKSAETTEPSANSENQPTTEVPTDGLAVDQSGLSNAKSEETLQIIKERNSIETKVETGKEFGPESLTPGQATDNPMTTSSNKNESLPINSSFAGTKFSLDAAAEKKLDKSDFFTFDGNKVSLDAKEYLKVAAAQDLAEKYPEGVQFDKDGYPDFSPYAIETVKVDDLTGKSSDFTKANQAAGLASKPENYTWHHHQDQQMMVLIPTDLHAAVRHTGGASALRSRNKGD